MTSVTDLPGHHLLSLAPSITIFNSNHSSRWEEQIPLRGQGKKPGTKTKAQKRRERMKRSRLEQRRTAPIEERARWHQVGVTNAASFQKKPATDELAAAPALGGGATTTATTTARKKNKKKRKAAVVAVDKDKTVFVSGLPHHVGMKNVRKYFKQCGAIAYVTLPKFEDTGLSRGIAQITFTRKKSAERVMALNGEYWGQRYLEITPHDGGLQWQPTMSRPANCKTIFVGNLNYDVTEDAIMEAFGPCGEIQSVRWGTEKESGDFRGFGHISFRSTEAVEKAVQMAGGIFQGRPLKIDYAEERDNENWSHKENGWSSGSVSVSAEAPVKTKKKMMSKALENRLRKEEEAAARKAAAEKGACEK